MFENTTYVGFIKKKKVKATEMRSGTLDLFWTNPASDKLLVIVAQKIS